ncbi:MAG TPA: ABC transporter substrate-binding protein [candidate division Zixibacteria bacterium]|nr:ABC transporter substrate-binding protein [candidate division Zixibacteria bacterium]
MKFHIVALSGLLLLQAVPAAAQKTVRIVSVSTSDQFNDAFSGFKKRMEELGYREGREVVYELRAARGGEGVVHEVARRLVEEKVDMILTSSTTSTVAVAKATAGTHIPVIFLSAGNPQKLVKSFAGSGTNLAGISSGTLEITGKRFELLRDLVPGAKRVANFTNPRGVNHQSSTAEVREAARKLGFLLFDIPVTSRSEIGLQAPTVTRRKFDAIFTPPDVMVTEAIEIIVEQSYREKLPLMTSLLANVRRGCLATYGANYFALGEQGAGIAHKILKGAKPSDLPIEQPMKFHLALNLKAAKAIGLTVPREILLRADEVIE